MRFLDGMQVIQLHQLLPCLVETTAGYGSSKIKLQFMNLLQQDYGDDVRVARHKLPQFVAFNVVLSMHTWHSQTRANNE